MNENPGEGTPNPLNPNPEASGGAAPIEPSAQTQAEPAAPMANTQPVDPTSRPMEKATEQTAEPKKKKTGLIVAILVCLLVAVGCGVAAALLMLNPNGGDPVATAMNKLMSGDTNTNVVVNGDIDINIGDSSSPVSAVKIDFEAKTVAKTAVNSLDASVKIIPRLGGKNLSLDFSEVYSESGDLYLKVDGITDAFENMSSSTSETPLTIESLIETQETTTELEVITDIDSMDVTTDTSYFSFDNISGVLDIIESLEGEWIRLATEELGAFSDNIVVEEPLSCVVDFAESVEANSNSMLELYNRNPFVTSSTENLQVTSRRDPIYKITIDEEKFVNYIGSLQDTGLLDDFYSCVGLKDYMEITAEDIAGVVEEMPEIYVEVNSNNVFTRLYLQYKIEDIVPSDCVYSETLEEIEDCGVEMGSEATSTVTIDLTFDYPANINISEPVEYQSLTDILQKIFISYGFDDYNLSE